MIQNQALEFALMEILRQRRKRCRALGEVGERKRSPSEQELCSCEKY